MVAPQDTPAYFDLTQIKGIIMFQFADRNMKVSNERGITGRTKGLGGNNKTSGKTV